MEVDIKTDGTLALPNEVLAEIDMVIASVHSSFDLNPEAQTKRLLKVINNPYVNIIGHPSGRLIGKREPINVDWEAIMQSCKAHEVALEINANPQRLDLSDSLIREAKKGGVKLSLGSDAHHQSNLKLMHYGIDVARRGGIEKHDIINCLSYQKVRDWLARKRRPLK